MEELRKQPGEGRTDAKAGPEAERPPREEEPVRAGKRTKKAASPASAKTARKKTTGRKPKKKTAKKKTSKKKSARSSPSPRGASAAREPVANRSDSEDPVVSPFEKPPLDRRAPRRSWLEHEGLPTFGRHEEPGAGERAVLEGVELGYQVSEEHMRLGRERAEQLGHGYYDQDPFAQLFGAGSQGRGVGSQLVSMWFELLSLAATRFGGVDGMFDQIARAVGTAQRSVRPSAPSDPFARPPFGGPEPAWPFGASSSGPVPRADAPPQITVETVGLSPAEVAVRLSSDAPATTLRATLTREGEAGEESGIRFEAAGDPGMVHVRVVVPEGIEPGSYQGQITDRLSGASHGWLRVRVLESRPR